MRIALFGATGPTGREILRQALAAGHEVRACVRSPVALAPAERLQIVRADVLVSEDVRAAVEHSDAVVSSLGQGSSNRPTTLMSEGTANLIAAMSALGVKRLVCVSSRCGVRDASEPFLYRTFGRWLYGNIFADHGRLEEKVLASALDWTIVRPTSLHLKPASGKYRVAREMRDAGWKPIARADVADLIVKELAANAWVKSPVALGG